MTKMKNSLREALCLRLCELCYYYEHSNDCFECLQLEKQMGAIMVLLGVKIKVSSRTMKFQNFLSKNNQTNG